MTRLAQVEALTVALTAEHDAHMLPCVGCRACVPEARAQVMADLLDRLGLEPTVDTWRGADPLYDARRLLATMELATRQGVIPPEGAPYAPSVAPASGTTIRCGIAVLHEPHDPVRVYHCEG